LASDPVLFFDSTCMNYTPSEVQDVGHFHIYDGTSRKKNYLESSYDKTSIKYTSEMSYQVKAKQKIMRNDDTTLKVGCEKLYVDLQQHFFFFKEHMYLTEGSGNSCRCRIRRSRSRNCHPPRRPPRHRPRIRL
jgi:hypothetical protein